MALYGNYCDYSVTPEEMSVAGGLSVAKEWANKFKNVFVRHDNKNPSDLTAGGCIALQQEIHHNSLPYRNSLHSMTPHGGPVYGYGRETPSCNMNPAVYRPMYHSEGRPLPYSHQLQAQIVDPGQRIVGMDMNGSPYVPAAQHGVVPHTSEFRGNVPPFGPKGPSGDYGCSIDRLPHGRLAPNGNGPRDSAPRLGMSPGVMMPPIADPYHMVPHTPYPRHAMPSRLGINKTSEPVYLEYMMHQHDSLSAQNAESYAGKRQDRAQAPVTAMSFVGKTPSNMCIRLTFLRLVTCVPRAEVLCRQTVDCYIPSRFPLQPFPTSTEWMNGIMFPALSIILNCRKRGCELSLAVTGGPTFPHPLRAKGPFWGAFLQRAPEEMPPPLPFWQGVRGGALGLVVGQK